MEKKTVRDQGITSKQVTFAEGIVSGLKMADAYKIAYDCKNMSAASVNRSAVGLMKNRKVVSRIEELRKPAVTAAALTAESHLAELRRLRDLALDAGKHEAAIRAEELRGKVAGLYVTRLEAGAPGSFAALSAEQKATAISAIKQLLDQRSKGADEVTDVEAKTPRIEG